MMNKEIAIDVYCAFEEGVIMTNIAAFMCFFILLLILFDYSRVAESRLTVRLLS